MRNIRTSKLSNIITALVLVMLLAMPFVADAQGGFRRPESNLDPVPQFNTATGLILRVIEILLAIAGLIAVIFLIIGGFRYITAGGNEESSGAAKTTIINAIIGIVVVILAFVIVRVVINALIGGAPQV